MMYRKVGRPSLLRSAGLGFFGGFSVFALGVFLDRALAHFGIDGIAAVIDDLLIGIVAGVLVFGYELHRYNAMLRQMRIIAEMNHHIRNALQPILYSAYLKEQTQQIRMIEPRDGKNSVGAERDTAGAISRDSIMERPNRCGVIPVDNLLPLVSLSILLF